MRINVKNEIETLLYHAQQRTDLTYLSAAAVNGRISKPMQTYNYYENQLSDIDIVRSTSCYAVCKLATRLLWDNNPYSGVLIPRITQLLDCERHACTGRHSVGVSTWNPPCTQLSRTVVAWPSWAKPWRFSPCADPVSSTFVAPYEIAHMQPIMYASKLIRHGWSQ